MYLDGLHGLGECTPADTWSAFWGAGGNSSPYITQCQAQGGIWIGTEAGWSGSCRVPAKCTPAPTAAPAQNNITVNSSPVVNTQVSPAISPNLIQQQQPTNSPVGASTSASPAQSTDATGQTAQLIEMLKEQQAQAAARQAQQDAAYQTQQQQAFLDNQAALAAQQAQAAAAAKQAAQQTAQPAMQSTTEYVPAPDTTATPAAPVAAPVVAVHNNNYLILAAIAAAVAGVALMGKKKGRKNVH